MVDKTEFMIMDEDDCRNEKFECDECETESSVDWVYTLEEEHYEAFQAEGWVCDVDALLCSECKDRLRK